MNAASFEIDPVRGYLPAGDPLRELPQEFSLWEDAAYSLPKLLMTDRVRSLLSSLPLVRWESLSTRPALERAMMLLSYLGHAYVWGEPTPPQALPGVLSIPWHAIAAKLGRPPVLSYASYALWNWRRIDANGPITCGNIGLLQNFLGGMDEEWFILIHIDIEARAARAMNAILPALDARDAGDALALEKQLEEIRRSLLDMNKTMDRMPEHCDPYIYYNRVRPYIHGWKDNPALPDGLIYEGVAEYMGAPQKFRGETGAQSSIVPALDALFGVGHQPDFLLHYLQEMRTYMPPKHRAFLEAIESRGAVREFVRNAGGSTKAYYNECVTLIEKFRTTHLSYAASYIDQQTQQSVANPTKVGTGGTPFLSYLKKHRDETGKHLL